MKCESIYLSWQTGRTTEVNCDVCVRVLHNVAKYHSATGARQQTDLNMITEMAIINLEYSKSYRKLKISSKICQFAYLAEWTFDACGR